MQIGRLRAVQAWIRMVAWRKPVRQWSILGEPKSEVPMSKLDDGGDGLEDARCGKVRGVHHFTIQG